MCRKTPMQTDALILAAQRLDALAYAALLQGRGHSVRAAALNAVPEWIALRDEVAFVLVLPRFEGPTSFFDLRMLANVFGGGRLVVALDSVEPTFVAAVHQLRLGGLLSREQAAESLLDAIGEVCARRTYVAPTLQVIVDRSEAQTVPLTRLSERQVETMRLRGRGLPLKEAALEMDVSYKTADTYRSSLFRKLGVRNRVALMRFAADHGLL
jgi:DNA-binding NarL/FixJ family response regulator